MIEKGSKCPCATRLAYISRIDTGIAGEFTIQAIIRPWIETWITRVQGEALGYLIYTVGSRFIKIGPQGENISACLLTKVVSIILKFFYRQRDKSSYIYCAFTQDDTMWTSNLEYDFSFDSVKLANISICNTINSNSTTNLYGTLKICSQWIANHNQCHWLHPVDSFVCQCESGFSTFFIRI